MDDDQEKQFSDAPWRTGDRRNHRIMWWERAERRRRWRIYLKWLGAAITVILTALATKYLG